MRKWIWLSTFASKSKNASPLYSQDYPYWYLQ